MRTKNKKYLIIAIIVVIIGGIFLLNHMPNKDDSQKVIAYNILSSSDISKVKIGNFSNVVPFTGDLSPLNQTIIASEVDAEVKAVKVAEGDFVKKNQVLALIDNSTLQESVRAQDANLASKIATFNLNQKKLQQQKELYAQGFISKLAYEELTTNYQASLEAINQAKAELAQSKKQLSYSIVRSPFSGYVYKKYIDNGQLATKGAKLFALASLKEMQIKTPIPSEQINQIKIGQDVNFTVETSSDNYHGKVTRINPVAIDDTRSFLVYINFNNDKFKLKSGQFVKGQIAITNIANTMSINNDAIRTNKDGSKYVLILQNNKVVSKPITILLTNSLLNTSAVKGLDAQDTLISNSIVNLKPNDLAKIVN